jgi:hypothetical protein
MARTNALALVDHKKKWSFIFQVLANALVCRLCSLACDNPLASIASPSNVTGLGVFVGLFGNVCTFFCMVCESSYEAVEVATYSSSTNIMGGLRAVARLALWWVYICDAWSYAVAVDRPAANCRCCRCHWA